MGILFLSCVVVFIFVYLAYPNGGVVNIYFGRYKRFSYALTTAIGSAWIVGAILLIIEWLFGIEIFK